MQWADVVSLWSRNSIDAQFLSPERVGCSRLADANVCEMCVGPIDVTSSTKFGPVFLRFVSLE